MTWQSLAAGRAAVCLLLLLCVAAAAAALPPCNKASALYKQGKLYDVLGLKKTASKKDIRKAFKKMSVACHPDKDRDNEKADDNFIAITGAYQTLSDDDQRREYDASGPQRPGDAQRGAPRGGGRGSGPQAGFGGQQQWKPRDFGDIPVDDILRSFFGGQAQGSQRGGGQPTGGYRKTFTFGGGNAADDGDDEGMFESLFRDFNFGGRGSARRSREGGSGTHVRMARRNPAPAQASGDGGMFGGMGGLFDGLMGAFQGLGDLRGSLDGLNAAGGAARGQKPPATASRTNRASNQANEKRKAQTQAQAKAKAKAKAQARAKAADAAARAKAKAEQKRRSAKARSKTKSGRGGCRFSVREGEICD